MKKIAVIGLKGLPAFGGAAAVGENLLNHLKSKFKFIVFSISSHTHLKSGIYKNIYQVVFKTIPFKRLNTLLYYLKSSFYVLYKGDFDLVHLHHRDAAFLIPLLRLTCPVLLTIHGFGTYDLSNKWSKYKIYFKIQEKFFIRMADAVTAVSKYDKNIIEESARKKVQFIPNGIDINIRKVKVKYKSDYLMFAAGRIISFKRCDIFLKALIKIKYQGLVYIAGDLEQTEDYKREIINLSNKLNVEFLGLIKNKNILFNYYANSKLFIFPSYREAMSMVLLEVASLKTPIICSDIPGNKNIFSNQEVLFFKTDDYNDLASKIEWASQNYEIMLEKAERAYKKLIKFFDWSLISLEYEKIYNDIMNNNVKK